MFTNYWKSGARPGRILWVLASVVAVWLLTWLLAWLLVPPLLKSQLESRGSAALGRSLHIGAIDFKPWTLELSISDISVATADGGASQLAIARVYVDAGVQSIFRLAPVLDAITIDSPRLQLTHLGGGRYDIDDLLQRLAPVPGAAPSAALEFALYNISVNDGSLAFRDQQGSEMRTHNLHKLQIAVPFVSNMESHRDVKVTPRLAFELNGSSFDSAADATPFATNRKGEANLRIAHLDLAPYLGYLPASLPWRLTHAVVDADVSLRFEQSAQAHLSLGGKFKASGLEVRQSGKPLLRVAAIELLLADVRPLEHVVRLSSIAVDTPRLELVRDGSGRLNLGPPPSTAGAPDDAPAPAASPANPWNLELGAFTLQGGAIAWTDERLGAPVHMNLADLAVQAHDLHWPMDAQAARFEASATLPYRGKAARLEIRGEGSSAEAQAHVALSDLPLGLGAAYTAQYLVPGLSGSFDADIDAHWKNASLVVLAHRLALREFAMREAGGSVVATNAAAVANVRNLPDLPSVALLDLTDSRLDLSERKLHLGKLVLKNPAVGLQRDADGNWLALRWLNNVPQDGTRSTAAQGAPAAVAVPWKIALDELSVQQAHVFYQDRAPAKPVRLDVTALDLQASGLTPEGKRPSAVKLKALVRSGRADPGSLRFDGSVMWDPLALEGKVDATDLPAHALAPYLADQLNIEIARADASFSGAVSYGATPEGTRLALRGEAALQELQINSLMDESGSAPGLRLSQELLNWKALTVGGLALVVAPQQALQVQVREAALSDFFARVVVSPQGRLNLQDLVKADPPAPVTASAAPSAALAASAAAVNQAAASQAPSAIVEMGPVSLVRGRVLFTDHFIQPNYSADLTELTGRIGQFSSQASVGVVQMADIELRGRAEGTASLEISGQVNPLARPLALAVRAQVHDLELPPLSAYSVKYAGYGIERGKLSMDVNYKVQPDGQLTASNSLILNQLTFGDKVEGAPNSLPVKLAVALLADGDGVIDINLPISGSLNDPQFSIGPVIWKVLTNLIVKAVTAPFSLLAHVLGGSSEELSTVGFAPGSSALSEAARAGLEKVASALQNRSSLRLTIVGSASLDHEREALLRERLNALVLAEKRRRAAVGSTGQTAPPAVDAAEYPALLKSVYRRADIVKPRNLIGMSKDISIEEMENLLLASIAVNENDMRELALQRSVAIKDFLLERNLPAQRLFLGAVKMLAASDPAGPAAELVISAR
jgi:hypothetical protein